MKRVLITLLCLAAAGGLGYSAFSRRWLENHSPKGHITFSLLSSQRCDANAASCESKSNSAVMTELAAQPNGDVSNAFPMAGQATLGLAILSALLLLLCAGYLAGNKRTAGPNGPQHLALVALMFALIAATVFLKLKPGGSTGVGVGPGFWVFGAACVLGIFAAQLASGLIKPVHEEPSL
jgi:hypothetical protein